MRCAVYLLALFFVANVHAGILDRVQDRVRTCWGLLQTKDASAALDRDSLLLRLRSNPDIRFSERDKLFRGINSDHVSLLVLESPEGFTLLNENTLRPYPRPVTNIKWPLRSIVSEQHILLEDKRVLYAKTSRDDYDNEESTLDEKPGGRSYQGPFMRRYNAEDAAFYSPNPDSLQHILQDPDRAGLFPFIPVERKFFFSMFKNDLDIRMTENEKLFRAVNSDNVHLLVLESPFGFTLINERTFKIYPHPTTKKSLLGLDSRQHILLDDGRILYARSSTNEWEAEESTLDQTPRGRRPYQGLMQRRQQAQAAAFEAREPEDLRQVRRPW